MHIRKSLSTCAPAMPALFLVFLLALCAGCGGGGSTTTTGGGGSDSTTVTITFSGTAMPTLVAAQIGTGAFTAQTLSSGTLSLSIPSGTSDYAVADLCPGQAEYLWEASIKDGTSFSFACPGQPNLTPDLTGSLDATAVPGVQSFEVYPQNGSVVGSGGVGGGSQGSFEALAPVGSDRVLVLAYNDNANQGGPAAATNFENQTVPGALNGGNTVVFGTADETTSEAIAYNNVPSGFSSPETYVGLEMGGGGPAEVLVDLALETTTQYAALPASATETGDLYYLSAGAYDTGSSSTSVVAASTTISGGPVSFTFPSAWSYAGPTPAALPSFTMGYAGFSGTNVIQNVTITWTSGSGASPTNYGIYLEATANYQSGSTTLAIPDLSGVSGFLPAPASGTQVQWSAAITQQSYGLGSQAPLNGTSSDVQNYGSYTAP